MGFALKICRRTFIGIAVFFTLAKDELLNLLRRLSFHVQYRLPTPRRLALLGSKNS